MSDCDGQCAEDLPRALVQVEQLTKQISSMRTAYAEELARFKVTSEIHIAEIQRLKNELAVTQEDDEAWRHTYESTHAELLKERAALDRLHEFSYFTLESMRLATADVKLVAMIRSFKSQLADLKGKKS